MSNILHTHLSNTVAARARDESAYSAFKVAAQYEREFAGIEGAAIPDIARYRELVSRPGAFELEPVWTPYYWELSLDGDGEIHAFYADDDPDCECEPVVEFVEFVVDYDESRALDIELGSHVLLWTDSQGFILARAFEDRDTMLAFIDRWRA